MSDSRVTVAIRCRPVNELTDGSAPVVYGENTMTVKDVCFKFDHIFPSSSNDEVYNATVSPKIDDLFKGINVTILAYGATGSGKTHTMGTEYYGSKGDREAGIIHRSVQDMFKKINEEEDPSSYSVRVTFIEVYGEDVCDLLQSGAKLPELRHDNEGFKIPKVLEIPVTSPEEVKRALNRGCAARKTAYTAKNAKSSRSHGIFTIYVEQKEINTIIKRAKFILVDLAGSERIDTSQTAEKTLREGIGINKGLMTLRQVIRALAEKQPHIPFRDSKLTKILQDALEGTSQTIIIACVYPTPLNCEETLNTLRYASLANSILIKPKTTYMSDAARIANLKKRITELEKKLNAALALARGGVQVETRDVASATSPFETSDALYCKYISVQSAMFRLQAKYNTDLEVFRAMYAKFKTLKSDLEDQVDSAEVSEILEDILGACNELLNLDALKDEEDKDADGSDEDKEDVPSSDSDNGASLSEKLNEISEMMSSNADTVKNLEEIAQSVEGVDQDIVACLVREIEKLTEEKDRLQEIVATAVDEKVNADRERVASLVEEINKLKADLKEKKAILQQKEASRNEINRLKIENVNLKQMKVNLVKQIKEAGTKYVTLNFEKKKELQQQQKTSRKMEVEKNRMVSKLEKEINVLKSKLNTIGKRCDAASYKFGRMFASRKPLPGNETMESLIKETLENVIRKKTVEIVNKKAKEDAKEMLPNFNSESDLELDSSLSAEEKEVIEKLRAAAKFYANTVVSLSTVEIKDQSISIDDTIKKLLNSVVSVADGKKGIFSLFKEFICSYEKMFVENYSLGLDYSAKVKEFEETIKKEKKSGVDQVYKVTKEKRKVEEINKKLVEQVESLSVQLENVKNLDGEPQMIEKLKMQESIIAELREAMESYKKKDTEIQSLSKDLFRAKKGKATPWLGPVPLRTTSREEELQTLVEEFLDETQEESVIDDENDPDWRLTPMYKRNKERLARKMPPSDDDDSPPMKKSTLGGCSCTGGCKTMRCRCRKSKFDCSNECACKNKCANAPGTSDN